MGKNNKMLMGKNKDMNKFQARSLFVILIGFLFIITISSISAMTIRSVVVTPSEVAPGEVAKITIEVENTLSSDVQNVNVALDISGNVPIAPYQGSSERNMDEIAEGDDEKFTFNVIVLPDAIPGVYKIPVEINYEVNGDVGTKTSTIGLVINSPPQIRVSADGYLIRGKEGTINVKVINDGLSGIKFASLEATQPFSGTKINSPLYEYIGNVESDDFTSVEYQIFAAENSLSIISIPIKISYKDSTNKDFTQDETLNINVYSAEEAKKIGLVPGANYTLYFIIGILLLSYIVYRIRKRVKKKKTAGA